MDDARTFVSRGGAKLEHALGALSLNITGLTCADLGCSTGGFTDCLLQHGAARVHAVDTGYGVIDYRLRIDPRVVVHERCSALHMPPAASVDLVVLDLGWTPQRLAVPAALKWVQSQGRIVSLIKPHYEATGPYKDRFADRLENGVLSDEDAEAILKLILGDMLALRVLVQGVTQSPVRGSGGKGNIEYLALLTPLPIAH